MLKDHMQSNMDVVKTKVPEIIKDFTTRFFKSPVKSITIYGPAVLAVQHLKGAIPKLGKYLAQGCSGIKSVRRSVGG